MLTRDLHRNRPLNQLQHEYLPPNLLPSPRFQPLGHPLLLAALVGTLTLLPSQHSHQLQLLAPPLRAKLIQHRPHPAILLLHPNLRHYLPLQLRRHILDRPDLERLLSNLQPDLLVLGCPLVPLLHLNQALQHPIQALIPALHLPPLVMLPLIF